MPGKHAWAGPSGMTTEGPRRRAQAGKRIRYQSCGWAGFVLLEPQLDGFAFNCKEGIPATR
jgi:hypothetical protein